MSSKIEKVLEKAKEVETQMRAEVDVWKQDSWHKAKVGLTIALVGVGAYWLLRKYLDYPVKLEDFMNPTPPQQGEHTPSKFASSTPTSSHNPTNDIMQTMKSEISVFLLTFAKQKIHSLLHEFKKIVSDEPEEVEQKNEE